MVANTSAEPGGTGEAGDGGLKHDLLIFQATLQSADDLGRTFIGRFPEAPKVVEHLNQALLLVSRSLPHLH